MNESNKLEVVRMCREFIAKRPCLDPREYIRDWRDSDGLATYRREAREITQALNDARALLKFCELYSVDLVAELKSTSRRLFINEKGVLTYHVGQYWPTEYRSAVCRAVASAIWSYWRDCCDYDTADKLRAKARAEFGRAIASRWFN